ncbi:MAG: deoxyribose-phosphate aldolase, partial [Eudoraea sp.]|nr:deoxyribose-phosphate aldolase [Eudoraea sp.]
RNLAGKPAMVADTMAVKYANSINSVHYFARLPYGLNDKAVMKRYLGESVIAGKTYHKIEVTFQKEGGGDDFDDIYVYWFNKITNKPDYLAYEFLVDGGGKRFRKALNERYAEGIRFVDYLNYKPATQEVSVYELDSSFMQNELELLSRIELKDIQVNPGNYN